MSQTGANTKQREPITSWFDKVIDVQGLSVVEDAINRSLEPLVGPDDELVQRVVKQSMIAFTRTHGNPDAALSQIAPMLWEIGDRHARREGERDELVRSFRAIQDATRQALRFIIAAGTPPEKQAALLTSINQFVEALFWHTVLGWQRSIIYAQAVRPNHIVDQPNRTAK